MEENICINCAWRTSDFRCNRLVSTGIGRNDVLGSHFKKGNKCPYFKQGNSSHNTKSVGNNWYIS